MKKDNDKYRPLEAHLLQSKVGGHYSIMVTLPNGGFIVGAIFPNLSPSVTERYDLVPDPEGAPVFETSTVITLKPKQ
jgi:hypothetical protein